jgi:hypothetical protein
VAAQADLSFDEVERSTVVYESIAGDCFDDASLTGEDQFF